MKPSNSNNDNNKILLKLAVNAVIWLNASASEPDVRLMSLITAFFRCQRGS